MMPIGVVLNKDDEDQLTDAFRNMMKRVHDDGSATLAAEFVLKPEVQAFIEKHTGILDQSIEQTSMSDDMREDFHKSNYVFSGMKTAHEANEAAFLLLDENGNRKPFEQFYNDVLKINDTYNKNYLRAEYNFIQASGHMAAKWEEFEQDKDDFNLQYRTAGDDHVRPEHAALDGITLPFDDPFWDQYYPPNGWNCRCTVVQVLKNKYPVSDSAEAMRRGAQATAKDKRNMFTFNAGKERKSVPDYNPYTISRCRDCDVAKGKINLTFIPDWQTCKECNLLRECYEGRKKANRENLTKWTVKQKQEIYSKPIDEQFETIYVSPTGYSVKRHILADPKELDFPRVLQVAKLYAKTANIMIMPQIHKCETDIRQAFGLPTNANPDLRRVDVNGVLLDFIDVKSPFTNDNIIRNANHAAIQQRAIPCITDHLCPALSDLSYIVRKIFKNKQYPYDEVHFYVEGNLIIKKRGEV